MSSNFNRRLSTVRRPLVPAIVLALASLAPQAQAADDHAACLTAADQGQTLRDSRKLLEARDALRTCGRPVCPAAVQKDCITWAEQLELRIPSVVLSATGPSGSPITNVKVTVDGKVVRTQLDGSSLELNPGSHAVLFDGPDGLHVEKTFLAREGEKNALVSVTIGNAAPVATPPVSPEAPHGTGGLGYAGYAVGGLGVVGVIVGSIFGAMAASDNSKAQCNSSSRCVNPQAEKDANSAAPIATVGLIAGAALVAGGLTMVLLDGHGSSGAKVEAAPVAYGLGGGGLSIRGAW